MGNSNSSGILVATGKTLYSSGETVTGTVYVNLLKPVKSTSITLRVSGKEKCHWSETHDNSEWRISDHDSSLQWKTFNF